MEKYSNIDHRIFINSKIILCDHIIGSLGACIHTTELLAITPRYLKKGSAVESPTSVPSIDVASIVKGVIDDVRQKGDAAVREYSDKFDKWSPQSFKLSKEQIDAAIAAVPKQTIEDIRQVQTNVGQFAQV